MTSAIFTGYHGSIRRSLSSCIGVSCVFAFIFIAEFCPIIVQAQVTQVNQGHVLDANPLVGSGGSNQPIQGYVPINNAVNNGNSNGGTIRAIPTKNGPLFIRSNSPPPPYYMGASNNSSSGINSTSYGVQIKTPSTATVYNNTNTNLTNSLNFATPLQRNYVAPMAVTAPKPSFLELPYQDYNNISTPPADSQISSLYGLRSRPMMPIEMPNLAPGATTQPANGNDGTQDANANDQTNAPGVPDKNVPNGNKPLNGLALQPTTLPAAQPQDVFASGQTTNGKAGDNDPYTNLLAQVNKRKDQRLAALGYRNTSTTLAENPTAHPLPLLDEHGQVIPGKFAKLYPEHTPGEQANTDTSPILGPNGSLAKGVPEKKITTQSEHPEQPNYKPKSFLADDDPLKSAVVLQAGRKVKTITTLVGTMNTNFEKIMRQSETLMKKGDYLHAAEFYQGAISLQPENALAVVGRAHAELAAGLYESAAYDLKFLYHRHPELMAVHYDLPAFMGQSRLDFVTDDVRALARKGVAAASFLACYFDYQEQRQDNLTRDFADWRSRHPTDAWGPIVEQAWIAAEAKEEPAKSENDTP